jgi:hypothetical protein
MELRVLFEVQDDERQNVEKILKFTLSLLTTSRWDKVSTAGFR